MVRREEARRKLKEVRTLQGWREAYKLAGLPDDGASANTKSKRLSRLINRRTGGFKELDSKQSRKIERSVKTKTRSAKLNKARAERAIKTVNRAKAIGRRETRDTFGEGGQFQSETQLRLNLDKNKPLTNAQKARIREAFRDGGVAGESKRLRATYATVLAQVDLDTLNEEARNEFARKQERANRAVERDNR